MKIQTLRLLVAMNVLVACSQDRTEQTSSPSRRGILLPRDTSGTPEADPSARNDTAAQRRMELFLDASRMTSAAKPDSLWSCWPDGPSDRYRELADSRVLRATRARDTVAIAAEVVTVAEEVESPTVAHRYEVNAEIHTDTMHWKMTRDSTGRWGVCDYPEEGIGFGHFSSDLAATWNPRGYNWARVERAADSIYRARHR